MKRWIKYGPSAFVAVKQQMFGYPVWKTDEVAFPDRQEGNETIGFQSPKWRGGWATGWTTLLFNPPADLHQIGLHTGPVSVGKEFAFLSDNLTEWPDDITTVHGPYEKAKAYALAKGGEYGLKVDLAPGCENVWVIHPVYSDKGIGIRMKVQP